MSVRTLPELVPDEPYHVDKDYGHHGRIGIVLLGLLMLLEARPSA